jgi:hypothetical protein
MWMWKSLTVSGDEIWESLQRFLAIEAEVHVERSGRGVSATPLAQWPSPGLAGASRVK